MPTYVYNKKVMMDLISTLEEDDIILLTGELLEASYSKKMGAQKVTFAYSPECLSEKVPFGILPDSRLGVLLSAKGKTCPNMD